MRLSRILLLACLAAPSAATAQGSVGSVGSAVVYGEDDRIDWYAETDTGTRQLARQSIAAIVATDQIDPSDAATLFHPFSSSAGTLEDFLMDFAAEQGSAAGVCRDVRFLEQPSIAGCSGTLIGPDQILTAGHCIENEAECGVVSFVFDYLYVAAGTPADIGEEDVYTCRRILAREKSANPHVDFAVIELDRPVVGRSPVRVRRSRDPLPVGTDVTVIGFGTGLPMKIDDGGEVTDPRSSLLDVFGLNTDTFSGNSGSGIFDDDGVLVGVLVTGQVDYAIDDARQCVGVNVLPETPGGESATYAFRAVDALCEAHPSSAACRSGKGSRCATSDVGRPSQLGPEAFVTAFALLTLATRRRPRTRS